MSDYNSSYGKRKGNSSEYVFPGSPDDRRRSAYSRDMYDDMDSMTGYGKKVSTKKNKTGTGEPNTGIQGSAAGQTEKVTDSAGGGTGRKGSSSYGKAMGSQLDNSVGSGDEYDYAKGRNKKGDQRKRVKTQGR